MTSPIYTGYSSTTTTIPDPSTYRTYTFDTTDTTWADMTYDATVYTPKTLEDCIEELKQELDPEYVTPDTYTYMGEYDSATFDPTTGYASVTIPLVTKVHARTIAVDLVEVKPMNGPLRLKLY